jgi:adenylate kinase
MKLLFLGPPGAGKGTQAVALSEEFGIPQISTGDILRQAVKDRSELGKKAKQYLDSGQLVPDELIIALVEERLKNPDCETGYILDGFPRTLAQAKGLDEILMMSDATIDRVIYFDMDNDVIVERLSNRRVCRSCGNTYNLLTAPPKTDGKCDECGGELYQRSDDKEVTIKQRLQVYEKMTQPLKAYYEKQGKLRVIDGSKPIPKVRQLMLEVVQNIGKSNDIRKKSKGD